MSHDGFRKMSGEFVNPVIFQQANTNFGNGREFPANQRANAFRKFSQRKMSETSGKSCQCDPSGTKVSRHSKRLGHYFPDNLRA